MKIKVKFFIILILLAAVRLSAQTVSPIKVHEFEVFDCEELKLRTHNLLAEISKNPGSKGYIIGYDGEYRRFGRKSRSGLNYTYAPPRTNELKSRLDLIKKQLVFLSVSPRNFVFIYGGVRKHLTIEYFVVPKEALSPKPTPTLKRIKHARGLVPQLTLGDC